MANLSNFQKRQQWATPEQIEAAMKLDQQNSVVDYGEMENFDEEKAWEEHCDAEYFKRHGGDPWWAQ